MSIIVRYTLLFSFTILAGLKVYAHEVRPTFLQIEQISGNQLQVFWKIPATGTSVPKIYLDLPKSWKIKETKATLEQNALIQESVYEVNFPIQGETITFHGLQKTIMDCLVTIKLEGGIQYTKLIKPEKPVYVIPEIPSTLEVSKVYFTLGIEHILYGIDHLFFVLALVLITSGKMQILKTITAFTVAHSITLSMATLGFVNIPSTPVEAVIALSIIFLALELVKFNKGEVGLTAKYPWVVAFVFGLLHGFGFAGALTEVGLPEMDIPFALAFFNLGVEFGQLVFVIFLLSIIYFIKRIKINYYSWLKFAPAYGIGIISTLWFIERILKF